MPLAETMVWCKLKGHIMLQLNKRLVKAMNQ